MMAKMWTSHPSYDAANFINNIALVYLPVDVYYSKNSAIANLYLKDPLISSVFSSFYNGQTVKVIGWGLAGNTGSTSNTLKEGNMYIGSRSICGMMFSASTKEICIQPTGSGTTSVCPSDEGSPVTKDGKLIGIVSVVTTTCTGGGYQLISSIYPFYDWVVTKLKAADAGTSW